MDFKPYDILTWKHLMLDDMTVGIILGIEYVQTGSAFTAAEYNRIVEKFNSDQDRRGGPGRGYGYMADHSTEPTWYKHQDIRFNVVTIGGSQSWHVKTVTPISKKRFDVLEYEKETNMPHPSRPGKTDMNKYFDVVYWRNGSSWHCDLVKMPFMSMDDVKKYIKDHTNAMAKKNAQELKEKYLNNK